MPLRIKLIDLIGSSLILIVSSNAWACKCEGKKLQMATEDPVPRASLLFFGTYIETKELGDNKLLKFKVLKTWKGTQGYDVLISTERGMCSLTPLLQGARVLFVSVGPTGGKYSICDTKIYDELEARRLMKKMPQPKNP